MFDVFRKHTKIMMVLLFLLVIPSFVLFGIDGYNRARNAKEVVAKIGSYEITKVQWEAAHKNEVDRLRAARPELDVKLFDTSEARMATLERMVRDQVLAAAAQNAYLMTSDARLARFLQEDPTIASLRTADGKLDMNRYRQLAANQGLTPEGFEASVRADISRQQVEAGVRASGFATPVVANVALDAYFQKREVQIVKFLTKDYLAKVNTTEDELETFYKTNESQFKAPEQAKVEYVVLDMDAVKKTITVSEADVKSYYEQNALRLSGKEERRASHILISAPKDAAPDVRQKAKDLALSLLKSVRAQPETFADVAKKSSQDPGSAAKGGDLGFFARGDMVKPFEDAVFAMKKGDISDVVESDFGYHIIRLTDVKLPVQRSFAELRGGIEADLKSQQAQRKFAEVAELFTNTVYEQPDSLQPVADKLGLQILSAENVTRQPKPGVKGALASDRFLTALFATDSVRNKRNTEAVEVAPNQLVAGRIVTYDPVRTLALQEVRAQVIERVRTAKAQELARLDGTDKLAQWQRDVGVTALPAAVVVSRDQSQGVEPQVVLAALRTDSNKLPTWLGVDLGQVGYAVVRVNKILPRGDVAQSVRQRDQDQLAQLWGAAELQAYDATLKEKFKVQLLVTEAALTDAQPANQ